MKILLLAVVLFIPATAGAQQAKDDPEFVNRMLTAIHAQRNSALDAAAAQQARADGLQEQLNKAMARIKELEGEKAK